MYNEYKDTVLTVIQPSIRTIDLHHYLYMLMTRFWKDGMAAVLKQIIQNKKLSPVEERTSDLTFFTDFEPNH